ncbi:alpha-ketoglutarate-dependent dioxygenase AlkB [Litorivivens sp.]|uniref:alpha-ketoglutarate-dependent dioxygenase AlkB family protein n=1 Tax=Litorivivens sp. TaxID=2020868 RepID=UPI003569F2FF
MSDLFAEESAMQWIALGQSRLGIQRTFLSDHQSWYEQLVREVTWEQPEVNLYGKRHKVPRLTAFQGDEGVSYQYSGLRHEASGWSPTLHLMKNRIDSLLGTRFNTVLLNWYRNGLDTMGFHADDERELGENPVIASVSLGSDRRFVIKRRDNNKIKREIVLSGGSLLVMADRFQREWLHGIPADKRLTSGRINLTFRQVLV